LDKNNSSYCHNEAQTLNETLIDTVDRYAPHSSKNRSRVSPAKKRPNANYDQHKFHSINKNLSARPAANKPNNILQEDELRLYFYSEQMENDAESQFIQQISTGVKT